MNMSLLVSAYDLPTPQDKYLDVELLANTVILFLLGGGYAAFYSGCTMLYPFQHGIGLQFLLTLTNTQHFLFHLIIVIQMAPSWYPVVLTCILLYAHLYLPQLLAMFTFLHLVLTRISLKKCLFKSYSMNSNCS